jgi:hypothetical protein
VLLLYTKIIGVVANAKPPTKDVVDSLVQLQLHQRGPGTTTRAGDTGIDEANFKAIATLLCRRIAPGLVVEAVFLFIVAPVFAVALVSAMDYVGLMDIIWRASSGEDSQERAIRNSIFVAVTIPIFNRLVVPRVLACVDREQVPASGVDIPRQHSIGSNPLSKQAPEQPDVAERAMPRPHPGDELPSVSAPHPEASVWDASPEASVWEQVHDPSSQRFYYVHRQTRETCWEIPALPTRRRIPAPPLPRAATATHTQFGATAETI